MEVSIEDLSVLGTGDLRRRSTRIRNTPSTRSNSFDFSRRNTPTLTSSPTQDTKPDPTLDFTTSKRGGLRRKKQPSPAGDDPMIAAMKPLTDEERQNWKGWVELESNPVGIFCPKNIYIYTLSEQGVNSVLRNSLVTFYENMAPKM